MRWPKLILQKRYRVEWLDFMGTINGRLSEVEPAACWSEGVLVKNRKNYLVLASSQYTEESKGSNRTQMVPKKNKVPFYWGFCTLYQV